MFVFDMVHILVPETHTTCKDENEFSLNSAPK